MEVYENPPRHTAKQVADDVAAGMDPDAESVPAQYYDQMKAERDEIQRRLDAVVKSLEPGEEPMRYMLGDQKVDHHPTTHLYARAVAIAEGRTE